MCYIKVMKYKDWKERKDKEEVGLKVLITQKLIDSGAYEVIKKAGHIMGEAIARKMFESYKLTYDFESWHEYDGSLRAWEDGFIVDAEPSYLPEQYCYLAEKEWLSEMEHRRMWEAKSLWEYLKYWFRRKFNLL